MNQKINTSLTIAFCMLTLLNFAQLFVVTKIGPDERLMYGYIDSAGKMIVPFGYKAAFEFSDSLGAVYDDKLNLGYINSEGKEIISCKYHSGCPFIDGYAIVRNDTSAFLMNKKEEQFPINNLYYSQNNYLSDGLVIVIDSNERKGYANLKNELVFPIQFDIAMPFDEGIAFVKRNDSLFFMDLQGKMKFIPYSYATSYSEGLLVVRNSEGDYGVVDRNLNVIINFEYDDIGEFVNGYAKFRDEYRWGLMNNKGEHVLPAKYVKINSLSENRILLQSDYTTATLMDQNFKVIKELNNIIIRTSSDLHFKNGLSRIFVSVGPTPSSRSRNVREDGGVAKAYINLKGEIVWQGEPYESNLFEN